MAVAGLDYFKITAAEGNGTGKSLQQFPRSPQDCVLADRGYCRANGIHFATRNEAYVAIRLNQHGFACRRKPDLSFSYHKGYKQSKRPVKLANGES